MALYDKKNTLSERHIQADKKAMQRVPDDLWEKCHYCHGTWSKVATNRYGTCPHCGAGKRQAARQRLAWLVDEFTEMDAELTTVVGRDFPGYIEKITAAQAQTQLNDAVLTGKATIGRTPFALGIMDPLFIMGSLGTVAGEKITRLFEYATAHQLPVVLVTASGGARMQEGIHSLMQMAKISQAIAAHHRAGLLYITILTDPTTGGVTASFAMDGDIILAEPHALIGFAGRRVIEQTIQTTVTPDLQTAENVLRHGFIDQIVQREDEKKVLGWLLKNGGRNDVQA